MLGLFDPVKFVEEILTIVAICLLLTGCWWKRTEVLVLLTGSPHIHANVLDAFWWMLRCGDTCRGDWTRCCFRFSFCPKSLKNQNLVTAVGRTFGFAPKTVEMKNLVIGDIPKSGRADFFICVECASNPDQCTSVAQNRDPRVVHFPEVFTLRIRHSYLESNVKITVRELNTFGFTDLCEVRLSAMQVLDWRDDTESLKRLVMKPLDADFESETPPWILVQFDYPLETRDLEHMHGSTDFIRTMAAEGHCSDTPIADFKHHYGLLDSVGNPINEPQEESLSQIRLLRRVFAWITYFVTLFALSTVVTYSFFRYYLFSCYQQFYLLTQEEFKLEGAANTSKNHFPVSFDALSKTGEKCLLETKGTGMQEGTSPCRPTVERVYQTCHNPPAEQPWPSAGRQLLEQNLGLAFKGLRCASTVSDEYLEKGGMWAGENDTIAKLLVVAHGDSEIPDGVCELRNRVLPYDTICYLACGCLLLLVILLRFCGTQIIRQRKNALTSKMASDTKNFVNATRTPTVVAAAPNRTGFSSMLFG